MTVLPQFQTEYDSLTRSVRRWERRTRVGQSAIWLPRAAILALIGGIGIALFSRLRPLFTVNQIVLLTGMLVVVAVAICLGVVWLRRQAAARLAIQYDVALGLGERVSTALDLIEGRIQSNEELTARQIADADQWAQRADSSRLPIRARGREISLVGLLVGVLALLLIIPNAQTEALAAQDAQTAAIEEAREELREITQDVASNPDVDEEAREALLETLEAARQTLDRESVSPEEAFATLSDVQSELSRNANDLLQRSAETQAALNQAANRLSQAMNSQPGSQNLSDLLSQLAEQMQNMSEAEMQAAGNAMQQAMQDLMQTNPELAEMMNQAAQNMTQGNPQAAQQNAQQASQSAQQSQQSAQQQQNAGEQLQENAQQAQQAAQQAAEPGSQPQEMSPSERDSQSGDQQSDQQSNQQSDQQGNQPGAEANPQQSGQQPGGQQSSEQQGGEQGEQQSSGGGQSDQASEQQSSDAQVNSAQSGDQSASGDPMEQAAEGESAGAGEQASDPNAIQSPFQGDRVEANNNPDGGGVSEYAPVYSPSRIGGENGEDQIFLESDDANVPSVDGEFSANPAGSSSVPYNQVFSEYSAAANRALNQNSIPLSLRDVIRNYFSSLEPGR